MARLKVVVTAFAVAGLAASLLFLYQTRVRLHQRGGQLQRLLARMAQLENDLARLSDPSGLAADDREAYLSLEYKEFDATYGSGHRRFRDRPQPISNTGVLVEEYLRHHQELPFEKRMILHFHAAQLFAMGGMNLRAVKHLDHARFHDDTNNLGPDWYNVVDATKAFLLLDREDLVAARQRMTGGDAAKSVDHLIQHFGESYADAARWVAAGPAISVPAGALPKHRAAADKLAKTFELPVTVARDPAPGGGIPGNCIWLEVRPMGSTPDMDGYIILHGNNSTVITATSHRWLELAVKRFVESSRQRNGKREVPFGLVTSFELAR